MLVLLFALTPVMWRQRQKALLLCTLVLVVMAMNLTAIVVRNRTQVRGALLDALRRCTNAGEIAAKRGKTVEELFN